MAQLQAQDTLSLYFKFGESKISKTTQEILESIPNDFETNSLDSIVFIGYADSVGSFLNNLKLSKKRALKVAEITRGLLDIHLISRIQAEGEKSKSDLSPNRRVDILFYYPEIEEKEILVPKDSVEMVCYQPDFRLLSKCNIVTRKRGKKKYINIILDDAQWLSERDLYYAHLNRDKSVSLKKVKWRKKKTGKNWWQKRRMFLSIPKEDFQFKFLFYLKEEPCDSCDLHWNEKSKRVRLAQCLQADIYIMNNSQFKTLFLRPNKVKIRVPRIFVDTSSRYFIGCKMEEEIKWSTNRREKEYLYTTLPISGTHLPNITKVMNCCIDDPLPENCNQKILACGFSSKNQPTPFLNLISEFGIDYSEQNTTAYLMAGFREYHKKNRFEFLTGFDTDFRYLASLRYQRSLFKMPLNYLSPVSEWQDNMVRQRIKGNLDFNIYYGSGIHSKVSIENIELEHNVHFGLSLDSRDAFARITRYFIQFGPSLDYFNLENRKLYFTGRIGMNFRLFSFKKSLIPNRFPIIK